MGEAVDSFAASFYYCTLLPTTYSGSIAWLRHLLWFLRNIGRYVRINGSTKDP